MNEDNLTCKFIMPCKIIYRWIISGALIPVLFFFCLSCASPEKQITGSWEMVEYKVNGHDEPEEIEVEWVFHNDGRFVQSISIPSGGTPDEAAWSIDHDKTTLTIDYIDKRSEVIWKIVRLEDDTLRVEYRIPGFFVEREFVRKGPPE